MIPIPGMSTVVVTNHDAHVIVQPRVEPLNWWTRVMSRIGVSQPPPISVHIDGVEKARTDSGEPMMFKATKGVHPAQLYYDLADTRWRNWKPCGMTVYEKKW